MNGAFREAETTDPKWARKEQRKLWRLKAITAGVMLALAVGTLSFFLGLHNNTEITHVEKTVEHSACQEDPAGAECQKTKARSSRAADLYVTCIAFHKVGYPCPKPGSEAAAERAAAKVPAPNRGDATSAPTGHSLPAPGNGGSTDQPSHPHAPSVPHQSGGGGEATAPSAAPTAPTSSSSSQQSTSSSTERVETTVVEQAAPETSPAPVREAVGGVVEEVGQTVTGTVEGVTTTSCSLAKLLCP